MFEPSRCDARLLQRALSQGWDIPAALRTDIITVLGKIVSDEKSTRRERTSAARAVMQASRVELDALRAALEMQFEHAFERLHVLEGGINGKTTNALGEDRAVGAVAESPAE